VRLLGCVTILTLCVVLGGSALASQDAQTQKAPAKPLTNGDVLDMLKAGLSQEIVIAKIRGSSCEFDTSPGTLKALKAANIPDAVILAMVEAPTGPVVQSASTGSSSLSRSQETTKAEASGLAHVECFSNQEDSVPVFSAPRIQQGSNQKATDSMEVFKVKCGDSITILGDNKQSWLKMRTTDGRVGYISSALISVEPSAEKATADRKRDEAQRAADELEDCKVRAQNEYETKSNVIGTMALSPMMRVYAANRLKQNLDAEMRACRSQYESRAKAIEAEQ
jgi:Bacterial SH3 domain